MPTPGAATSFTLTPESSGSPVITLAWAHTGTNLDRFLVLYRTSSTSSWKKVVVAPAADFGAGPYEFVTATGEAFDWKVVALGTAGERSATNPTASFSDTIDGVWLVPLSRVGGFTANTEAWIGARHPDEDRERAYATFPSPFDSQGFSQAGRFYLRSGTVDGLVMTRHSVSAQTWMDRLRSLIAGQKRYERVVLASARDFFPVELTSGYSAHPRQAGGQAWDVSVPFRELKR